MRLENKSFRSRPPTPKIASPSGSQRSSPQYVEIPSTLIDWPPRPLPAAKRCVRSLIEQRNAAEGIPMEKKWRVSNVELLEGGLLFGFALYDQKGMPCVSFGYQTEAKAIAGRDHVVAALNGAQEVLCG
jgi:hypothetical protein